MAQIKFYRGGNESSLPNSPRDGSIYIIDTNENSALINGKGKMFVDVGNRRLQISPSDSVANVQKYTKTELAAIANTVSSLGQIYLIIDENDNDKELGFKIGDGDAYIIDLPWNYFFDEESKEILNTLTEQSLSVSVTENLDNTFNLNFSEGLTIN